MKIKSIISMLLVLMLVLSTTVSAQTDKADWTQKVDEKGKTYYHNVKTDETIVQAFRYNEDGELVEVSLEEAMPHILESIENAKEKEKEEKVKEKDNEGDGDVSVLTSLYFIWDYDEVHSDVVWGASEKVTPDCQGPTTIQYATEVQFSDSYNLSISATGTVKEVIEAGASFGWSTSSTSSTSLGLGYEVPAGSYGAVYFAPYYNYTRGTLTKETWSFAGGHLDTDTWYNQSAKSPKTLGNGLADGYFYLVLNG